MPHFYRDDTVTRTFNSQFAARSAFHLVKWIFAAASPAAGAAPDRVIEPVLLMLQRMIGPVRR